MKRREFLGFGAAALLPFDIACGGAPEAPAAPPTPAAVSFGTIGHFSRFGIDPPLLAATLARALARGGDAADLFFEHRVTRVVVFEDGAVTRAGDDVALGMGVRVIAGEQSGYASTGDLSPGSLSVAAGVASEIATGPASRSVPPFVSTRLPDRYPVVRGRDREAPPIGEIAPILSRLGERALASDSRIQSCSATLSYEETAILIADSAGRLAEDRRPMTILSLVCVAEDKGKRRIGRYDWAGRGGLALDDEASLTRLAHEASSRATALFDAAPIAGGEMPVVLAPASSGSAGLLLHMAVGHALEADVVQKDASSFAGRLGQRIAGPLVTLVDDATIPGARGSINVDDEGNAAGKTTLIDRGILTAYLHDALSAKRAKTAPTGSGRRESYQHAPLPRMRATTLLPGPHHPEEIIASVKRGIYVSDLTPLDADARGDLTLYVESGWLIEAGKLTRPLTGVTLVCDGPKLLVGIDLVGGDAALGRGASTCTKLGQRVPVSYGTPTVRIAKMTVLGPRA